VTVYEPSKAYNGLTLYTSGNAQKAVLISMDGKVVHEWKLTIPENWEDPEKKPRPAKVAWEYAHVYPNGDLLALVIDHGHTPIGCCLVKIDKNSKVIWKYIDNTHHHLNVADDGTIYALTHEMRYKRIKGYEQLELPRLDDSLAVVSPDGKLIKKVSIVRIHYADSAPGNDPVFFGS